MASLPKKIIIEAQDLDKVQTMIELLSKYRDELPVELMDSLNELADCEACEYDNKKLNSMLIAAGSVECLVDGIKVDGVVSANIILKRLTVYPNRWNSNGRAESNEKGFIEAYKYPDNFVMNDKDGNKVLGWN